MTLLLATMLGCSGGKASTLTEVQADVFDNSCAFSTCHGAGSSFPTLEPGESWAALVGVPSEEAAALGLDINLVEPGDHENSYLWRKCANSGEFYSSPMPDGSDGLDADHLAELESWIDAGAMDD